MLRVTRNRKAFGNKLAAAREAMPQGKSVIDEVRRLPIDKDWDQMPDVGLEIVDAPYPPKKRTKK